MEDKPRYIQSHLMDRISKQIFVRRSPDAFAIANLGNGPLLAYRNNWCAIESFHVHFICGNQRTAFSQHAEPPYYIAVCKEKDDAPMLVSLYQSGPTPNFESEGENDLTGHIIVSARSSDGNNHAIAQAILLPRHDHIFANVTRRDSLLLEGHPELCSHLLMCSALIEDLLGHQSNLGGICNE